MAHGDYRPPRNSDNDVRNQQHLRFQQHNIVLNFDHRAASIFTEQERTVGQYISSVDISSSPKVLADVGLA